jgi:succinate dehydrogenase flavin-adding protein (antitoxin of CptAB toxin-antitoxin module)
VSLSDTIQLVTLVTIVIALGLTVWQARQMMKQTALMFTEVFDHAYDSLMQAHTQQRMTFFLNDPELLKWHLTSRGYRSTNPLEDKQRLYALVKLEAHESAHLRHLKGTIDDAMWRGWRQVLETDLKVPIFADVWVNGRQFYDASFEAIVDEILAENAAEIVPAAGPAPTRPD